MNKEKIIHNNKEYEFVGDQWGYSLDTCIKELQKKAIMFNDKLWYIEFNNHVFYSDEVSLDDAYKLVLGKSYGDYMDECNKKAIETEKERKAFDQAVPDLIKEYEKTGMKIINKKYHEHLKELIPESLKGTYRGWDLIQAFEIISMLNDGSTFEECDEKMSWQSHSGFSFGLVVSIISELCDRGPMFKEYINKKYFNK